MKTKTKNQSNFNYSFFSRLLNLEKRKQKAIIKKEISVIEKINGIEKKIIQKINFFFKNASSQILNENKEIVNRLNQEWELSKSLLLTYKEINDIFIHNLKRENQSDYGGDYKNKTNKNSPLFYSVKI